MIPIVRVHPSRAPEILKIRHPWIFSGALDKSTVSSEFHGQLVSVFCRDVFIGIGYYNSSSSIAVRLLSRDLDEIIDKNFFMKRLRSAFALRQRWVLSSSTTACRMVFGESDGLPGFIVDKYNESFILQISTLGAENLKSVFLEALTEVARPLMIYEKSSGQNRVHEGLQEKKQALLKGDLRQEEIILEHGVKYHVNFITGQKTGFFFDQRDNRACVRRWVCDRKVLNVCAYTGGFSVQAAMGGALFVESVDISPDAVEMTGRNFSLNGISADNHHETVADAFEFLKNTPPCSYDVVILDPPAFVKSAKQLKRGLKGYITLNSMALRGLSEGGLLITASCSGAVDRATFAKMLNWASIDAGCSLRILEKRGHAADHPLIPNFPEAEYLKFFVCSKEN